MDYNPKRNFVLKAETIRLCLSNANLLDYFCCKDIQNVNELYAVENSLGMNLQVIVSHGDCICKLPSDSILVGTSDSCENEIYITGLNKNIMGIQSHPEFDLKYAIYDRIWPAVVNKGRLTDEEVIEAKESFKRYDENNGIGAKRLNTLISCFLHG